MMAKSFIRVFLNASGKRIGESHPGAKLTDHECDLVAQLVADGMTLSAVIGKAAIMDAAVPGGLGSTYAGHPVAVAASLAVLEVIEKEKLADRAAMLGEKCRSRLNALRARFSCIADVRGLGAMTAVEFSHGGDPKKPAGDIAAALKAEAAKRGLLLLNCGSYGNVLRLMLPLTIPDSVLDEGMEILEASLTAAVGN